jgi:hypothetical protein
MLEHNCPDHLRGFSMQPSACTASFTKRHHVQLKSASPEFVPNPADMIAVNEAYDLACQTLQNIGQTEVDREIIARGILQAAKAGERGANKLCERAIHGLTAFDNRQHGT